MGWFFRAISWVNGNLTNTSSQKYNDNKAELGKNDKQQEGFPKLVIVYLNNKKIFDALSSHEIH